MEFPWTEKAYDSGIAVQTPLDRFVQWLQPFLVVLFGAMTLLTTDPIGVAGAGAVRLALCLVCVLLMLTVRLPDRIIDGRRRRAIATAGALASGALLGLCGQGWGGAFAYMMGVHSGVRFPARTAIWIVSLCVGTGVVAGLLWGGSATTPWWTPVIVFAALIPGMTRRARMLTLGAAHEVVVQTRRAAESAAESHALAERAAIARDIHDVLAHSLSGVNMQLSLAEALFESDQPEPGRVAVRTAQRLVVDGLAEARVAVQTLRGDTVDPVEAIDRLTTGPDESFSVHGEPYPLSSRAVHALVRTAQESVTNARRHAPGGPLRLQLQFTADGTVFTARNEAGTGPAVGEGSGLGLIGMRERAAGVDATVDAGPIPSDAADQPGGWLVRWELPRPQEE